ncbi:septum formation initiator family protein [Streptomyces sp. NPDC006012]|uniref:septum formation initiator family protein n=1 Tax=Streptomyces sp. NPDC006012 TaxID=3364739 RepID=UPI003689A4DA
MARNPELRGRAARLARLLPAGRARAARTPFVLLVVLLLGGGLIGLLVLNSALSEGSFRLDDLQKRTKNLTDEEQALRRDIDAYAAPDALQRRARELGMVPGGEPAFLDPDGSVKGVPSPAARQSAVRSPAPAPPEALATASPSAPVAGSSAAASGPPAPPAGPPAPAPAAPASVPSPSAPRSTPTPTPGR